MLALPALGGGLLAAAGCRPGGQGAPRPPALSGEVRLSYTEGPTWTAAFTKLAEQFRQLHPSVQVAVEPTFTSGNNTKYIASAVAGSAADLVFTTESLDTQLYVKDIIQPLDAFIARDPQFKAAAYFDTVMAAYKFRGKQIALPILWGAYVLWYNKSMFDRAGQKYPDESWTWETFLNACRALTKPSSDAQVMGDYGFETRNHQNVWSQWIWGSGGDLFNADGTRCTLDAPQAIEGFQFLIDLIHRWKVTPTLKELTDRGLGTNGFLSGRIGMVSNAIYSLPTYRKVELFDWDIAFVPKGSAGRWSANPTTGLAMWKETRAPDTSWAFLSFLMSADAQKTYVNDGVDGMPVHREAAQLILQDARPPRGKQAFFDAFRNAKPAFITPYGRTAVSVLSTETAAMWADGVPARGALTAAVPKINQAIQAEIDEDTKR
jgi:multiple sugar transport system substrate-binding protein